MSKRLTITLIGEVVVSAFYLIMAISGWHALISPGGVDAVDYIVFVLGLVLFIPGRIGLVSGQRWGRFVALAGSVLLSLDFTYMLIMSLSNVPEAGFVISTAIFVWAFLMHAPSAFGLFLLVHFVKRRASRDVSDAERSNRGIEA